MLAAPAVSQAVAKEICCLRAYRFGGFTPAFPAQWLYGLYEIVLVTGFLATIAGSKLSPLANLTPAPGRRTQTISPYALPRSSVATLRPSLPCPAFATMAYAPLVGQDGGSPTTDLPDEASDLFLIHGIDTISDNQK